MVTKLTRKSYARLLGIVFSWFLFSGASAQIFRDVTSSSLDVPFTHSGAGLDIFPDSPACSSLPSEQQAECGTQRMGWLGGVAIADLSGDGWDDMFVTNGLGGANALYINQKKKSISFKEVAAVAGVEAKSDEAAGVAAGDINNDGLVDLYVANVGLGAPVPNGPPGLNRLFINQGNNENGIPVFVDRAVDTGAAGNPNTRSQTVSLVDFDRDGDLDIFISSHHTIVFPFVASDSPEYPVKRPESQQSQLLRNLLVETGNLTFEDATDLLRNGETSRTAGEDGRPIFSSRFTFEGVWSDIDNDKDLDLLQANDLGDIGVFASNKGGNFTYNNLAAGVQGIGAWMSMTVGDLNGDGYMDFFSTNVGKSTPVPTFTNPLYALYLNDPKNPGSFDEVAGQVGAKTGVKGSSLANPAVDGDSTGDFGWGGQMFDFDNDGDLDLLFVGNWFSQGFGVSDGDPGPGNEFAFPTKSTGFGHTNRGHLFENKGNNSNGIPRMVDRSRSKKSRFRLGIDNPFDARCVVVGDLNNDGLQDAVISNMSGKATNGRSGGFKFIGDFTGGIRVFRNQGTSSSKANKSLNIRLRGRSSNYSGIGARVTVFPSGGGNPQVRELRSGEGHLGSNGLSVIFGLGRSKIVKKVKVEWPNGRVQVRGPIKLTKRRTAIRIREK